jgi:molecular chaperone GrpE
MTDAATPESPTPDAATRIAELEGEVARLRDTVLRGQADQQNQQRRHQRDREDLRKFATTALLEELLPSLDSLALGLASAQGQTEGRAVAEGFRMAVTQLRATLSQHGLAELNPLGQPFNPSHHEAVSQEASDTVPEGSVTRVARPGWSLHERVLRPAAVFVSTGPAAK